MGSTLRILALPMVPSAWIDNTLLVALIAACAMIAPLRKSWRSLLVTVSDVMKSSVPLGPGAWERCIAPGTPSSTGKMIREKVVALLGLEDPILELR